MLCYNQGPKDWKCKCPGACCYSYATAPTVLSTFVYRIGYKYKQFWSNTQAHNVHSFHCIKFSKAINRCVLAEVLCGTRLQNWLWTSVPTIAHSVIHGVRVGWAGFEWLITHVCLDFNVVCSGCIHLLYPCKFVSLFHSAYKKPPLVRWTYRTNRLHGEVPVRDTRQKNQIQDNSIFYGVSGHPGGGRVVVCVRAYEDV